MSLRTKNEGLLHLLLKHSQGGICHLHSSKLQDCNLARGEKKNQLSLRMQDKIDQKNKTDQKVAENKTKQKNTR